MGEGRSIWVGKDEHHGVRAQPRKDLPPPPHWRLEAIAHTPRPRTPVGRDRRPAGGLHRGPRRPLRRVAARPRGRLAARAAHHRPRAGAVVGGHPAAALAGRRHGGLRRRRARLARARGGRPAAQARRGRQPAAGSTTAGCVIDVERDEDRTTRLAVVDVDDPWPRRLAVAHGDLDAHGDEGDADASPDGTEVAYTFTPRADQSRSSEIRVASIETGEVRRLTGVPDMHDGGPRWSPDGETIAYASERSGFYELHLVGRDGSGRPAAHERGRRPHRARLASGRHAHRGRARRPQPLQPRLGRRRPTAAPSELAPGGIWDAPQWTAAGDVVAAYEDHATPRELRPRHARRAQPGAVHAPGADGGPQRARTPSSRT